MPSECKPWHRADADVAKAEAQRCGAAVRQMTAERERLQQQVRVQCPGFLSCAAGSVVLDVADLGGC
jgi:hypothetical protein